MRLLSVLVVLSLFGAFLIPAIAHSVSAAEDADSCPQLSCSPKTSNDGLQDSDCDGIPDIREAPGCTCGASNTCGGSTGTSITYSASPATVTTGSRTTYTVTITGTGSGTVPTFTIGSSFQRANNGLVSSYSASAQYIAGTERNSTPSGVTLTGNLLDTYRVAGLQPGSTITITYEATITGTASSSIQTLTTLSPGSYAYATVTVQGSGTSDSCPQLSCSPKTSGGLQDSDCDGIPDIREAPGCTCDASSTCGSGTGTNPSYTVAKTITNTGSGASGAFRSGDTINYRIVVKNTNEADGTTTLTDTLPSAPSQTLTSNGASVRFIPNEATNWNGPSVTGTLSTGGIRITNLRASQGQVTATYSASVSSTANSGTQSISNTAQLSSGQTSSASASIASLASNNALTLRKAVSNSLPSNGDLITYTITVTNIGDPQTALNIQDSFGNNNILVGNRGGSLTFQGSEVVTMTTLSGVTSTPAYSGSIGRSNGLTITSTVPTGATVQVQYAARVDSSSLGVGITSAIFNTAKTAGTTDSTVQVTLTGSAARQDDPNAPNTAPYILPIPNQVSTCGNGFAPLDLTNYVGDANQNTSSLQITVDGNRYLQAFVNPYTKMLTVTDPIGVQNDVNEYIRINVRDAQGLSTSQSVTYTLLRNPYGDPVMSGIPDQVIRNGDYFGGFNLLRYTRIGGQPVVNRSLDYYVTGSTLFDVTVDSTNTVRVAYDDNIFRVSGVDQISEELTFHIRGCSAAEDKAIFTVVRDWPENQGPVIVDSTNTQRPASCVIVNNYVNYPDTDCDGIPDRQDNCPTVPNPNQRNTAGGNMGDACNLLVSCNPVATNALDAGKTLSVQIQGQNNIDATSTTTRYAASIDGLNIKDTKTSSPIARGEIGDASLKLRVPECTTPGNYRLTCSVTTAGVTQSVSMPIKIGAGSCGAPGGNSSATIYQMQDVIMGSESGASYPIMITNDDSVQRTYRLTVDGVVPWGDYVFEDGGVIVVPAGETATTNLRVFAQNDAIPGSYPFKVTMKSGDTEKSTILQARVQPASSVSGGPSGISAMTLFWFGLVVIVFGAIVYGAYVAGKSDGPTKK